MDLYKLPFDKLADLGADLMWYYGTLVGKVPTVALICYVLCIMSDRFRRNEREKNTNFLLLFFENVQTTQERVMVCQMWCPTVS